MEQSISGQFLWSQEKEVKFWKEIEELKKEQEQLNVENAKAIEELKREHGRIAVEKSNLWDNRVWLEEAVSDSC